MYFKLCRSELLPGAPGSSKPTFQSLYKPKVPYGQSESGTAPLVPQSTTMKFMTSFQPTELGLYLLDLGALLVGSS